MREFRKHIIKALSLLGVVFTVGIQQVKAANIVSDFIGGVLGNIAEPLANALAGVVAFTINTLGSLLFNIASFFVAYTVDMNLQLQHSNVIPTGLGVTIPLANILLILALVIAAFATMVRANWLVEIRQAIPKIVASILILNFTFLIFGQMIIPTVDKITGNIYSGVNYSEDTFRRILKPKVDVQSILKIQLAIENAANNPEDHEAILKYLNYRDDFIKSTWTALTKAQREEALAGKITNADKVDALNLIIRASDHWLRDPQHTDIAYAKSDLSSFFVNIATAGGLALGAVFASSGIGTVVLGLGAIIFSISATSDAINVVEKVISSIGDVLHDDWKEEDLKKALSTAPLNGTGYGEFAEYNEQGYKSMVEEIRQGMIASADTHFGCDMKAENPGGSCSSLVKGADLITKDPTDIQMALIRLGDAAFNGTWAFVGILTLFALGTMLFMRYVVLALLIILFPIVLILWPFPKLSAIGGGGSLWETWWGQFLRWLFFAPIMMFFLWLAIYISQNLEEAIAINVPNLGSGHSGLVGAAIGELAVVAGFLVAGLYAANKMSITGSKLFYEKGLKGAKDAVGRLIKKGALAPGKYAWKTTKEGLSHVGEDMKIFGEGRRAELLERRAPGGSLLDRDGKKKIKGLLGSDSRIDRIRGHRLMRQARKREQAIIKAGMRGHQIRGADGKIETIPGGYRRADALKGVLDGLEWKEVRDESGKVIGKTIDPDSVPAHALSTIAATIQSGSEDDFNWEQDFVDAAHVMQVTDGWNRTGTQKPQNKTGGQGLKSAFMQRINEGQTVDELVEYLAGDGYASVIDGNINIHEGLLGGLDDEMFGLSAGKGGQLDRAQTAWMRTMTEHRPRLISKHLSKMNLEAQRKMLGEIERTLGRAGSGEIDLDDTHIKTLRNARTTLQGGFGGFFDSSST